MHTDTDVWLEFAARFSILASVLVIIYFFVYTAYRIVRIPNNPWSWRSGENDSRQEIHQTPTQMPFTFKLKDDSVNDFDQFIFNLCCQEKLSTIRVFWAVDASYLFKIINSPSWDILTEVEDSHLSECSSSSRFVTPIVDRNIVSGTSSSDSGNSTISDKPYIHVDTLHLRLSEDEKFDDNVTLVAPKDLNWRSLNNQYKYPLAIFILKSLNQPSSDSEPISNIVGLCVILHMKNKIIPRPTTILAQYIKLSNGQAHMLKSLYVMDGAVEEEESSTDAQLSQSQKDGQPFRDVLCSVCQSFPVSRAIIPCRHVCLCGHCFVKVQNCPICRGAITCFFKTRNEEYLANTSESDLTESTRVRPLSEILTGWNDNVNAALGFRE